MTSRKSLSFLFACIMLLLVFVGCRELRIASIWRDREITIDGTAVEWQNALTYHEDSKSSVGVFNDQHYLLVCLTSVNRRTAMQMAGAGFTVWFDPEGGKDKTFGIHFPLGLRERGNPMKRGPAGTRDQDMRDQGSFDQGSFDQGMRDAKGFQKMFEDLGTEIEILGPGEGQRVRAPLRSENGITVSMAHTKGRLVYELKVPLAQSDECPHAIGTRAGKTIGIGFETSEIDRAQLRERAGQRPGGMAGQGGKGGMGGMGGMRGRMGDRGGMPEPFKLWTKVTLASEPSSDQK